MRISSADQCLGAVNVQGLQFLFGHLIHAELPVLVPGAADEFLGRTVICLDLVLGPTGPCCYVAELISLFLLAGFAGFEPALHFVSLSVRFQPGQSSFFVVGIGNAQPLAGFLDVFQSFFSVPAALVHGVLDSCFLIFCLFLPFGHDLGSLGGLLLTGETVKSEFHVVLWLYAISLGSLPHVAVSGFVIPSGLSHDGLYPLFGFFGELTLLFRLSRFGGFLLFRRSAKDAPLDLS